MSLKIKDLKVGDILNSNKWYKYHYERLALFKVVGFSIDGKAAIIESLFSREVNKIYDYGLADPRWTLLEEEQILLVSMEG